MRFNGNVLGVDNRSSRSGIWNTENSPIAEAAFTFGWLDYTASINGVTTSFTATSMSIGTEAADRIVYAGVILLDNDVPITLSNVTIGGVAADEVARLDYAVGGNYVIMGIYSRALTTGTTTNIVLTTSAAETIDDVAVVSGAGYGLVSGNTAVSSDSYGTGSSLAGTLATTGVSGWALNLMLSGQHNAGANDYPALSGSTDSWFAVNNADGDTPMCRTSFTTNGNASVTAGATTGQNGGILLVAVQ